MAGPTREWVTFDDPKEERRWQIDVTYLLSSWTCIFGAGCQGVLTAPAPELVQGCCSYGAHFSDKKDRDHVVKVARNLTDDEWQYASAGRQKGIFAKAGKDEDGKTEWRTRLADDACIFLNRPGFDGGVGCALHIAALDAGERPLDWKPNVCWQVPIRLENDTDENGHVTSRLREWKRRDWGEGGHDFHWWCTEAPEAFVGREPVYKSSRDEIVELVGAHIYDLMVEQLERPGWTPLPHPTVRR